MRSLMFSFLLILAHAGVAATAPVDDAAAPAAGAGELATAPLLQQYFPDYRLVAASRGAVLSPGSEDVALLLRGSGARAGHKIVIATRHPDGSLRLSRLSRQLPDTPDQTGIAVEISKGSLYLRRSFTDCCVAGSTEYQFKARGGDLRLIGIHAERFSHTEKDNQYRYINSANLLTGDKVDRIEDMVDGQYTSRELKTRIAERPAVDFENFDFRLDFTEETRVLIGRDFQPIQASAAAPAGLSR